VLFVTPAAADAVTSVLEAPEVPEGAGLRLQEGTTPTGEAAVGIAVVTEPYPEDATIDTGGKGDLFLAPEVIAVLDDQILDVTTQGENVGFLIRPQGPNGEPSNN
jgi:iron-sulfur cluster assembly protein